METFALTKHPFILSKFDVLKSFTYWISVLNSNKNSVATVLRKQFKNKICAYDKWIRVLSSNLSLDIWKIAINSSIGILGWITAANYRISWRGFISRINSYLKWSYCQIHLKDKPEIRQSNLQLELQQNNGV